MRLLSGIAVVVLIVGALVGPAVAADGSSGSSNSAASATAANGYWGPWSVYFGSGIGAGMIIIGAGYGIGKLATAAVESMARQPEVAGNVQTAMIIAAALIEGVTFFALIICFRQSGLINTVTSTAAAR